MNNTADGMWAMKAVLYKTFTIISFVLRWFLYVGLTVSKSVETTFHNGRGIYREELLVV